MIESGDERLGQHALLLGLRVSPEERLHLRIAKKQLLVEAMGQIGGALRNEGEALT